MTTRIDQQLILAAECDLPTGGRRLGDGGADHG